MAVLVTLACAGCAGCAGAHRKNEDLYWSVGSEHVSREYFHGVWSVEPGAGTLRCDRSKDGAITFSPDNATETYAVNGAAATYATQMGWKDFHDIWLWHPDKREHLNPSDFLLEGQRVCDGRGSY